MVGISIFIVVCYGIKILSLTQMVMFPAIPMVIIDDDDKPRRPTVTF